MNEKPSFSLLAEGVLYPLLSNPDKVVRIVATLASYGEDMLYGGLWEAWRAREYP